MLGGCHEQGGLGRARGGCSSSQRQGGLIRSMDEARLDDEDREGDTILRKDSLLTLQYTKSMARIQGMIFERFTASV